MISRLPCWDGIFSNFYNFISVNLNSSFPMMNSFRQKNGTCMSNMILDSTTRQLNSNNHPHYLLKFCPRKETAFLSTNYPSKSPFSVGQCIIVSTEKSYALLMGTITRTDGIDILHKYSVDRTNKLKFSIDRQITIKSDRTLDTQDATSIYHIDKYVSASSFTKVWIIFYWENIEL